MVDEGQENAISKYYVPFSFEAEQYDRHFKINIGENFDMNKYGARVEEKARAIKELRDVLGTLKYEIWESVPARLEELIADDWGIYVEERFCEWPYFNPQYIAGLVYQPKDVTSPQKAFAYKKKLIPPKVNAFLLRER